MIVVSGEALMDVFDAGATPTGQSLDARIGGSPLNVAIGLARLGQRVAFFGAVGRGFLGERLMQALHAEGVDTAAVARVAAPTTLGLVGLDAAGVADYAFYGEGGADRQLHLADLDRVPQAAAYHFGSYSMVVEPVGSTLRELARRVSGHALVSYDVNVRTNVEPDLARWHAVLRQMLPHVHLLKLSDEDLQRLHPGEDEAACAQRWLDQGASFVLVTHGGAGARGFAPAGPVEVAPVTTRVIDTVGAGDTFQAALLAALAERGQLSPAAVRALPLAAWSDILAFAARAAAITCSRRGADLPRRGELG
ncbi:MAG: carbohydrate kinase [Burkholderiales bacterium]|nr:carbohydrate kinase [Burkholderiales bacterium]